MNDAQIIMRAADYLREKNIKFLQPGVIGNRNNGRVEVIFMDPLSTDPTVMTIDPPDIRVWVYIETGLVELIQQM